MTKRKKGYLEMVLVLIVFSLIIFIFDLPTMRSFIILGVIVIVNIVIFELFVFSGEDRDKNENKVEPYRN
ncbi:hypothetical protein [Alteribacillus sp. HJP-4]|uniref:hypothetical protein n=1 Tax=Alteribacillus sp. HJP-4 TaxID=2775394 RepID=UPI0035CCD935